MDLLTILAPIQSIATFIFSVDMDLEPTPFIDRTEAGDLFNFKPQSSEYTELRELGLQVYKQVWKEFYEWEPTECQRILDSFAGRRVPGDREKYNKMIDQLFDPALQDSDMRFDDPTQHSLIVTQYDAEGRGISYPIEMEEISVDPTFESHPPYESCPPINQSIISDPGLREAAAFIPYADQEDFPVVKYLEPFQYFMWREDFDPDWIAFPAEMIQIETARRLHSIHHISAKNIDRMGTLKRLRETHNRGLLWEGSQRDFLRWPGGAFAIEGDMQTSFEPAADDLRGRLSSVHNTFCPNLNCLRTLCTTHTYRLSGFGGARPKVTNQGMRLSEGEPCGEECFRLTDDSYSDKVYWENESDLETLKTILSISPDPFPCQLAEICFKPCREVFAQRSHIFPDHMVFDDDPAGDEGSHTQKLGIGKKVRKPRLNFEEDSHHASFVPLEPCNHKGPCIDALCNCYRRKRRCQLACRCGIKCLRQYRGCTCKRCHSRTTNCPCVASSRECLPGLCTNCDARPCNNTRLQRNDAKAVDIKRAQYGLGAFAAQDLKDGDYIGDYVGMSLEDADHCLEVLTKYTGRNYLFEVSSDMLELFDAALVGNATRFLNHNVDANCEAKVLLVNGEHHIGFYTIKAVTRGEELFLNYGEAYWIDKMDNSEASSD